MIFLLWMAITTGIGAYVGVHYEIHIFGCSVLGFIFGLAMWYLATRFGSSTPTTSNTDLWYLSDD